MRPLLGEDVSLFDCENDLPEIYEITSSTTELSLHKMLPLIIVEKYEGYQMRMRCMREENIRSR